MTSYSLSIVTMALSCIVSEIFDVENCRDLEIGVRGHSRSLKVVPFGLDAFSGQSRSTNMVPFWVHCDFSLSM